MTHAAGEHEPRDGPAWGVAGLAALAVATPLVPSEAVGSGCGVLLILITLALTLGGMIVGFRRPRSALVFGLADALLLSFLAWHTLSGLWMAGEGHARSVLNIVWQWLALGLIWFLARQWVRRPSTIRALTVVGLALAAGLATYGFYQCLYSMPRDRAAFERDPEGSLREAGIVAPPGSPLRAQYEDRLRSREPLSTFALTNSLAGLLAPWLIFSLGLWLVLRSSGLSSEPLARRVQVGVVLAAVLIGGCLLLTKSRSAYVATLVGVVALGVWAVRARWQWNWKLPAALGSVAALLIALATTFGFLDVQVVSEARKSLGYRWEYWTSAAAMIGDYPLLGCGPGNFQEFYAAYKLPQASEMVADPHNFLMEIAATAGGPALILWLAALLAWAWRVARRVEANSADDVPAPGMVYAGAGAGVIVGFIAAIVAGFAPDIGLLGTAVPVAVALIALLDPWVREGRCSSRLLLVSLVALGVNLLAAGGIGFPGVALTWWLFGACALNLADSGQSTPRPAPRFVWGILTVSVFFLMGAFYVTMYRPLLTGGLAVARGDQAWAEGRGDEALDAFREASTIDPWGGAAWMRLASLRQRLWLTARDELQWREFVLAARVASERNRRSQLVCGELARLFQHAYREGGRAEALDFAEHWARRAVELYPNSNAGHARLAWLLHLNGDDDEARREAAEALRLDALNPHREQKLERQTLDDYPTGPAQAASQRAGPGSDNAKQWMERLAAPGDRPEPNE